MKANDIEIVQTLFFNTDDRDPMDNSVRFLSPEFHWMSWALSCLQLKKLYSKVTLFTNEYGAEVLINKLNLPYDTVDLRLSEIKIDSGLGVLPKIYTYSFQKQPFLHFDGDVFMWERLDDQLLTRPLIAQNPEIADSFYRSFYNKLLANGAWFPDHILNELNSDSLIGVFNAGIIGGSNIEFFQLFTKMAFDIMDKNSEIMHLLSNTNFNLTYEQHLFYCLARFFKLEVSCYIPKEVINLCFDGYADFLNAPHKNKFIHLLGDYKKEEYTCLKLARRLRNDYPDFYYRIINECRNAGVKLYLKYYENDDGSLRNKTNDENYWDDLYEKEKKQFKLVDERFGDADRLSQTIFVVNSAIAPDILVGRNSFDGNLIIKAPVGLIKEFNEFNLDALDRLILELLKTPRSFEELTNETKALFDEEEIKHSYNEFVQLISSRLKTGVEDNLFEIFDVKYE